MKLSNIFLFIGAAAASYKLVENRQKIQEEIIETTDSLDKVKDSLANIQRNIAIIQEQREQVKDIAQDLTYKYKVLERHLGKVRVLIEKRWVIGKQKLQSTTASRTSSHYQKRPRHFVPVSFYI